MAHLSILRSYFLYFRVYLSSSSSNGCEASYDDVFVQSPHSELETKYGVTDLIPTPSVPNHALQAFRYLSGSNEAQVSSVVSSQHDNHCVAQNHQQSGSMQPCYL